MLEHDYKIGQFSMLGHFDGDFSLSRSSFAIFVVLNIEFCAKVDCCKTLVSAGFSDQKTRHPTWYSYGPVAIGRNPWLEKVFH